MIIFKVSSHVFVAFAVSFLINNVVSDWYTAVVKLEHLIIVEEKMISALERFVEESEQAKERVPDNINTFLTDVSAKNAQAFQPHFVENPINAYHFVKRMADWNNVIANIQCDECILTQAVKTKSYSANKCGIGHRDFKLKRRSSEYWYPNIGHTPVQRRCPNLYAYTGTSLNQSLSTIHEQSNLELEGFTTDIVGAAIALVRVWHTYKLDLEQLFRGRIFDSEAEPLSADDIYKICSILDDRQMYYKEIVWLEEFVRQVDYGFYTGKTNAHRAYKTLAGAYFKYGMPWKSEELLRKYLEKDPDNQSVLRDLKYYTAKLETVPQKDRALTLELPEEEQKKSHYEALCRGDIKRDISVTSKLKCYLKPTLVPILHAKEEVLNYDPRVSMYYDVITEDEMMFLKGRVMDKRSGIVGNITKPGSENSHTRISQTAWVHDDLDPIIRKYTSRIELFTGLSTQLLPEFSHAEELQILNYGVGGMYEPHPDWFGYPLQDLRQREGDPPMLIGAGDRVATWLTYLNSVTAGGATVFVNLNITVPVVKGAAAFWYNMKRTGECDQRTWHAGCPVLIGSKWAANKWFREGGNMFRRKCGVTPDAMDGPIS